MKFKVSFNALIIGIVLLLLLVLYARGKQNSTLSQRKQEISQAAVSTDGNIREIKISAKQFSFSPNVISLKLDERVRFRITSEDVTHGFSIPEFGINEVVEKGKEIEVDFHASKKGRFTFLCSIECGTGHTGMRGTIIIE